MPDTLLDTPPETTAAPPPPSLRDIVSAMVAAGEKEDQIAAVIQGYKTRTPSSDPQTLFWRDHPVAADRARVATGLLPLAGAEAGALVAPEGGALSTGAGGAVGKAAEDTLNEHLGLADPTSMGAKAMRAGLVGGATALGAKVLDPETAKLAARTVGPGLANMSAMGGAMAVASGITSGSPTRVLSGLGVLTVMRPVFRAAGDAMAKWGNRDLDVAFVQKAQAAITNAPGHVGKLLDTFGNEAQTPGQKDAIQAMKDAWEYQQSIKGDAAPTSPYTPEEQALLARAKTVTAPQAGAITMGGKRVPATAETTTLTAPTALRFRVNTPPADLVANVPGAGVPEALTAPDAIRLGPVSRPKVPVAEMPASTSKAARAIGDTLSPNDVDYLAEKWGVKAGLGSKLSALRQDVADDLIKARASRHTTNYENARSDATYRRQRDSDE